MSILKGDILLKDDEHFNMKNLLVFKIFNRVGRY